MSQVAHGTDGGYTNHGCRCDECRLAHNAAHQRWRDERRRIARPPLHVHGKTNGYNNYGCRCADCTLAQREYQREWAGARHA